MITKTTRSTTVYVCPDGTEYASERCARLHALRKVLEGCPASVDFILNHLDEINAAVQVNSEPAEGSHAWAEAQLLNGREVTCGVFSQSHKLRLAYARHGVVYVQKCYDGTPAAPVRFNSFGENTPWRLA
jgi:hypothetical protein